MKKQIISLASTLSLILTGCAASSGPSPEPSTSSEKTPGYSENVSAESLTAHIYKGKSHLIDGDEIKQIFIPDYNELTSEDFEKRTINASGIVDENGKPLKHSYEVLKDGTVLSIDPSYIEYTNGKIGNVNDLGVYGMNFSSFGVYPTPELLSRVYPFTEIDGLASQDALKMAQNIIDKLGLPDVGEPDIFTVPAEKGRISIKDDSVYDTQASYYISYPVSLDGADLPRGNNIYFEEKNWYPYYGYIDINICAEGIYSFSARDFSDYVIEEDCAIISKEETEKIYSNTIGKAKDMVSYEVSEASLTYVGNTDTNTGDSELYPAWDIVRTQLDDSGAITEFSEHFFFDAQTGQLLK